MSPLGRRVGIAALIYALSNLASRLIGVVREGVIGRTLGAGGEADVYFLAFGLPDFLNYLLAGGAVSLVLIPLLATHGARGDEDSGWLTLKAVATVMTLGITGVTGVAWLAAPWLAPALAPGFDAEQQALLVRLYRILLPAQIFHITGGVLSAALQSRDRHGLPALAPLVYTGGIICMGLLFGREWGAEAFAWGVLLGSALGPFALMIYGVLKAGMPVGGPWWDPRHPDVRRYLAMALPIMLGFSVVMGDEWVQAWFGTFQPEGTVARLKYARTLIRVPMGVFGLAAGMAAYPTLARLWGEGQKAKAREALTRALRMLLVPVFVSQAALTVAGSEIAAVIWGQRLFSPDTLDEIGLYVALMGLGLAGWATQGVLARGFYMRQITWTPTLLGSAVMLSAIPIYWLLGHWLGGAGLAAASALSILIYCLVLALRLKQDLGRSGAGKTPERDVGDLLVRLVPATAIGVLFGWALKYTLAWFTTFDEWPLPFGALCGGVAALLTLVISARMGVPEVNQFITLLKRRLRRR